MDTPKEASENEATTETHVDTVPDVVTEEIAEAEVLAWLEYKKVGKAKRETYKDNIKTIEDSIVQGYLVLDRPSFDFKLTLKFPLSDGKKETVKKLKFKPRIRVNDVQSRTKGVGSDGTGLVKAYTCALTGVATGVIGGLDTEDYSICSAITIFFLS